MYVFMYMYIKRIDERLQEGMVEMGFQPSDDTDVESLFPKDVKLTASDFMTGIVFDDEAHEMDDSVTPTTNNDVTARRRTKEFFRKYVDDVYNGKVGTLPTCHRSSLGSQTLPVVLTS